MERLTGRYDGQAILICENEKCDKFDEIVCCPAAHACEAEQNMIDRLADYEDAEEQGLLVFLPVKAGDIVYQLRDKKHALGVGVHPRYISCVCVYGNDWIAEHQGDTPCWKKDLGKTWFLTREEAEAALAKDTNVPDKEG